MSESRDKAQSQLIQQKTLFQQEVAEFHRCVQEEKEQAVEVRPAAFVCAVRSLIASTANARGREEGP